MDFTKVYFALWKSHRLLLYYTHTHTHKYEHTHAL